MSLNLHPKRKNQSSTKTMAMAEVEHFSTFQNLSFSIFLFNIFLLTCKLNSFPPLRRQNSGSSNAADDHQNRQWKAVLLRCQGFGSEITKVAKKKSKWSTTVRLLKDYMTTPAKTFIRFTVTVMLIPNCRAWQPRYWTISS